MNKRIKDTDSDVNGSIPRELKDFFSADGRSLILRGAPGTGKTTLALELLSFFSSTHDAYFISGRIDEQALKRHLHWIDINMLLSKGKDDGSRLARKGMLSRKELDRLESRVEEGDETLEGDYDPEPGAGKVENDSWTIDMTNMLPEIDKLYEKLEATKSGRAMVAIDSIDSLAEKYGIAPRRLIHTIQKDLVERSNFNVIFILETSESNTLEFMGDGVVSLEMADLDGRRMRLMRLEKLRGQTIWNPVNAFSLASGHFDSFVDCQGSETHSQQIEKVDMAGFLQGIIEPGKYNLFEFEGPVPMNVVQSLAREIVKAAAIAPRGVYTTLSTRMFGRSPSALLEPHVENYLSTIRFISPVSQLQKEYRDMSTVPVDGESFFADFEWSFVKNMFPESGHPMVFIMDANQLLSQYSAGALNDIENHIANLVRNNGTCVGFSWPSGNTANVDFGMSDRLIKVRCQGQNVLFYGEKPHSPIYVLAPVRDGNGGHELRAVL
jgi:KaiC/GvpD/RAD55 family RecA-like ATPase